MLKRKFALKKYLFVILTLVFSTNIWGSQLHISELRVGDVLLISLNCYTCRMIESETQSPFSHSGIVLIDENNKVRIAQSLGKVAHYSYEDFAKNKTPGTLVHVYRARQLIGKEGLEKDFLDVFNEKFKGAPFDSKYSWNNFSSDGQELLYCSEFIAKFIDYFLIEKSIPTPISYRKNYEYWLMYFKGVVPEGELGNSPASFMRDQRFEFIGTLK